MGCASHTSTRNDSDIQICKKDFEDIELLLTSVNIKIHNGSISRVLDLLENAQLRQQHQEQP